MQDSIAERHLTIRHSDGVAAVVVRIGAPIPEASGENWLCPYEIKCGTHSRAWRCYGIDAVQALLLTISIIDRELQVLADKLQGELYFLDHPFTSILENGGLVKAPQTPT